MAESSYCAVNDSSGSSERSSVRNMPFVISAFTLHRAWTVLQKWRPWWTNGSLVRLQWNGRRHWVKNMRIQKGSITHGLCRGPHSRAFSSWFPRPSWRGINNRYGGERNKHVWPHRIPSFYVISFWHLVTPSGTYLAEIGGLISTLHCHFWKWVELPILFSKKGIAHPFWVQIGWECFPLVHLLSPH